MCKMARVDSSIIWNALQGLICVYKPAEMSVRRIRKQIISRICSGLSDLDVKLRYPMQITQTEGIPPHDLTTTTSQDLTTTTSQLEVNHELKKHSIDLSYHPQVIGPRYIDEDLTMSWSNHLGWNTSGVLMFGLRQGTQLAKFMRENRPTRSYLIKCCLGQAMDNGFKHGRVVERSTWKFIRQNHIERILSAMQASHQKKMFETCGVDMQSQLAYELAVKSPIRPADSKIPIIYGIKCVEFDAPSFTLEINCLNENEQYLTGLVHEIGTKLHSTAHCTSVKCIRHSCFTLDHALLPKHWTLENLIENLEMCNKLLHKNEHLIHQDSVALR